MGKTNTPAYVLIQKGRAAESRTCSVTPDRETVCEFNRRYELWNTGMTICPFKAK